MFPPLHHRRYELRNTCADRRPEVIAQCFESRLILGRHPLRWLKGLRILLKECTTVRCRDRATICDNTPKHRIPARDVCHGICHISRQCVKLGGRSGVELELEFRRRCCTFSHRDYRALEPFPQHHLLTFAPTCPVVSTLRYGFCQVSVNLASSCSKICLVCVQHEHLLDDGRPCVPKPLVDLITKTLECLSCLCEHRATLPNHEG